MKAEAGRASTVHCPQCLAYREIGGSHLGRYLGTQGLTISGLECDLVLRGSERPLLCLIPTNYGTCDIFTIDIDNV
jgi:hypothetical protein